MIRRCVAEDPTVGDGDDRCGQTFDDFDHSTICPHDRIPTREEREAAVATYCAATGHELLGATCPCGENHL